MLKIIFTLSGRIDCDDFRNTDLYEKPKPHPTLFRNFIKTEGKMYQPKIKDDQVEALYRVGKPLQNPMTHLIRQAVDEYLAKFNPQPIRRENHEPRTFRETV